MVVEPLANNKDIRMEGAALIEIVRRRNEEQRLSIFKDGYFWTPLAADYVAKRHPSIGAKTKIKETFRKLEKMGVLVSKCLMAKTGNRIKYYRVDMEVRERLILEEERKAALMDLELELEVEPPQNFKNAEGPDSGLSIGMQAEQRSDSGLSAEPALSKGLKQISRPKSEFNGRDSFDHRPESDPILDLENNINQIKKTNKDPDSRARTREDVCLSNFENQTENQMTNGKHDSVQLPQESNQAIDPGKNSDPGREEFSGGGEKLDKPQKSSWAKEFEDYIRKDHECKKFKDIYNEFKPKAWQLCVRANYNNQKSYLKARCEEHGGVEGFAKVMEAGLKAACASELYSKHRDTCYTSYIRSADKVLMLYELALGNPSICPQDGRTDEPECPEFEQFMAAIEGVKLELGEYAVKEQLLALGLPENIAFAGASVSYYADREDRGSLLRRFRPWLNVDRGQPASKPS
jgi:hypothetical protein